ncbi:class I SAM-dependent methyltransferase, partial [Planctomycetota bacterium]
MKIELAPVFRRFFSVSTAAVLTGCAPTTIEKDGHRIFNPTYLFYLESDKRVQWQKPNEVIAALHLSPTDVVADVGAGGGYFTEHFSRHLSQDGHVYATDVQDVMIAKLQQRIRAQGLENVEVIKAPFDNPMLPEASCDLVFFSSVYKEIHNRPVYMEKVRRSLKPNGRVAILEYRLNEIAPGPPRNMRLTPTQITEEMETAGFHLVEEYHFL